MNFAKHPQGAAAASLPTGVKVALLPLPHSSRQCRVAARELRHPESVALSVLREMEEIGLLLPLATAFSEPIISRCLS